MRDRMTYVCNDCGEGFDDPETRIDRLAVPISRRVGHGRMTIGAEYPRLTGPVHADD